MPTSNLKDSYSLNEDDWEVAELETTNFKLELDEQQDQLLEEALK